jgi:hypothetical protein
MERFDSAGNMPWQLALASARNEEFQLSPIGSIADRTLRTLGPPGSNARAFDQHAAAESLEHTMGNGAGFTGADHSPV